MKPRPSWIKRLVEHKVEAIVLGVILIALVTSTLIMAFRPRSGAESAKVFLKGEELYSLSLREDKEIDVTVDHGVMHISVKNGGVAVISSPCPSQYCVNQGYRYHAGESILCAHEGLAVYLYGGEVTEVRL